MSPRKQSMLDAFHTSSAPTNRPPAPAPRAWPSPPRPRNAEPSALAVTPSPERARAPRSSPAERRPVFVLAGLAGVLALAGAFWLGRASVASATPLAAAGPRSARAPQADTAKAEWDLASLAGPGAPRSEDAERAPSTTPATTAAGTTAAAPKPRADERDAQGRTADDRAFYDPDNRFTVRAIRYANTPNGWQHALVVYRYLREQGLPAIAPIDSGELIVICVGAEPLREGRLAEIRQRLEELPGPPPRSERGAFSGAYYDNIDHLIERAQ